MPVKHCRALLSPHVQTGPFGDTCRTQATPRRANFLGLRAAFGVSWNPLAWLTRLREAHGDVVPLNVLGQRWVVIASPDVIEDALVRHAKDLGRDIYTAKLRRTLGWGLLTTDDPDWRRQRKLMSQAFTPKRIGSYADTMVAVADDRVRWTHGATIDLHAEMSQLTVEIVARVLFGSDIGANQVREVAQSVATIDEFYANPFSQVPAWIPTSANRELQRAVEHLDALIADIVHRRRRARDLGADLLGTLLEAVDDRGSPMSDRQLRDEALTLFFAGHETAQQTLSYTLMLLAGAPSVQRALHEEVDRVVGERLPTRDDVPHLKRVRMAVCEAMRLYPPVWIFGREVRSDIMLGGLSIAAGTQLIFSPWLVHRNPGIYPDPEIFDPARFSTERARQRAKFAFLPFGGGPRVCIGNHFAMMEATLLLTVILQRIWLYPAYQPPLQLAPAITLRARRGVLAVAGRRPAKARSHST